MEFISDIAGVSALVMTGIFIAILLAQLFSPKKKKRISVVKKYISEHKGLSPMRSRETVSENYIIQCRFPDSKRPDKIHTLNCNVKSVYSSLKTGKTYSVEIKMFEIIRVCKK